MAVHLHHIVPRSLAPAYRTDLRNGLPLCAECHTGWHGRTLTLYLDLLTPEEASFVATIASEGWLRGFYPQRETELPF